MKFTLLLVLAFAAVAATQNVPPQGNMTCTQAINMACAKQTKGMNCLKCIKQNYKKILEMGSGCSRQTFEKFCGTNTGGATKCPQALKQTCGKYANMGDMCFNCTTTNSAKLDDADCSNKYIQSFCRGTSANNDTCPSALAKMCPQVQHQGAKCFTCVRNNTDMLRDAGCSTRSYSQYCRRGAPAPTPGGMATCMKVLNANCEAEKGQGPACYKCVFGNYSAVIQAGCNGRNFHSFCGRGNVKTGCSSSLTKYCGAYKGQKYYCFQCVVSNTDTLKAANCTVDNYDSFCEGKVGNNCTATLRQLCGRTRRNEKQCTSCVQRNKAATDAAGCQTTDVTKFCVHSGGKTPGRTPFGPFSGTTGTDPTHPIIVDNAPELD